MSNSIVRFAGAAGLAVGMFCATLSAASFPGPTVDENKQDKKTETVVLAGGCFWGVEAVFDDVKGVREATAGYAGGSKANAHYEIVSSGTTGHAESVQVTFDPSQVSFGKLLEIYFSVVHDPTELNRQGPDEGTQYRSEIFYTTEEQKKVAEAYVAQLNSAKVFHHPIVTKIAPLQGFYQAEDYHQDYVLHCQENSPLCTNKRYVVYNDLPKLTNLRATYPDLVKGGK
ncbi:MAG TPA: peptide-methionine (S)-S-oxide reductase MsrA [Bryobacteraceae bacterium]|nr:peptide-methionine (S)-S-oxide reductase MsrA [Bryobacteraceae bacterium]